MSKASKSRWFGRAFAIYNRNLLKRRFDSFNVAGLENLEISSGTPLLLFANHTSWWDGMVVYELAARKGLDFYVLMEKKQLLRFPLFRKLGAIPIDRENPRRSLKDIEFAAALLSADPNRTVLIFPQGKIFPNDFRPVRFFNGISKIVKQIGKCSVISLSLRYEFLGEFKPAIFVKVSGAQCVTADSDLAAKTLTRKLAADLTASLDEQRAAISAGKTGEYLNLFQI